MQHQPAELRARQALDAQQQLGPPHVPETAVIAEAESADTQHARNGDPWEVKADLWDAVARLDHDAAHVLGRNAQRAPKRGEHVEPTHAHDEVAADEVDGHRRCGTRHLPIFGRSAVRRDTDRPNMTREGGSD